MNIPSLKSHELPRVVILIPIALSAFTHLWNPGGFPDIFYDEGVYMRRAMHILDSGGPQESSFYDHPYFGQLFLAGTLSVVGYPSSLDPSATSQSIETLYAAPRILMGLLAIIDTFLIYAIAGSRYGRIVALISAVLFAVMPISWLTRRILLDSILLPFLLSSILFALYSRDAAGKRKTALILISGLFLGTAIFTKIPAFTMVPLVGYLVYSTCSRKSFGLWFVPLIGIPLIWPFYSISVDQFDLWQTDVLWQAQRQSEGIGSIIASFFRQDPVLLLLGLGGIIYSAIKRDIFILLWVGPFLLFLSLIGYIQYFYWIAVLPVFCIAGAKLIARTSIFARKLPFVVIGGLGIFGLVASTMLITTDMTSAQFEAAAFVVTYADEDSTIVSSPSYSWLFIYVFDKENAFRDYRDLLFYPVKTENIVLVSDRHFQWNIAAGEQLQEAYNSTKNVAVFEGDVRAYDTNRYPYTNMATTYEGEKIEVRSNK